MSVHSEDSEIIAITNNMINENYSSSSNSTLDSETLGINIDAGSPLETIKIDIIQEESNLIEYTKNNDLRKRSTQNMHIDPSIIHKTSFRFEPKDNYQSNSPITMSYCGSNDSDSDGNSNSDSENLNENHFTYKSSKYHEIEKLVDKYYDNLDDSKSNSELDILTTYIKGQKHLYIQSKNFTQSKLNCLTFPSLFLTAFITVIAPFIECQHWSTATISGINAIITLCISLLNYLKLESAVENYTSIAHNYDKLETSLELTNNRISFLEKEKERSKLVITKLNEIEKRICEIKESGQILIPNEVKNVFPIICHINIFSFIKRVEAYKKTLLMKFKDIKNEIRYISTRLRMNNIVNDDILKYQSRMNFLNEIKEKIKQDFMDHKNVYNDIDEIFSKEIKLAEQKNKGMGCFLYSLSAKKKESYYGINPVIDKYFHVIFEDT